MHFAGDSVTLMDTLVGILMVYAGHGVCGIGQRNLEGRTLLEFCLFVIGVL